MIVGDLMSRDVETIHPTATLRDAAERMRQHNIGALPICDAGRVIGMLTDRDITVRATALGRDPNRTMVHEVVSRDVACCNVDDDVRRVAEEMRMRAVRRMPVLDRYGNLLGVVSIDDLAPALGDARLIAEVLERAGEGWGSRVLHNIAYRTRRFLDQGRGEPRERELREREDYARDYGYGYGEPSRGAAMGPREEFGYGYASGRSYERPGMSGGRMGEFNRPAVGERRFPKGYKRSDERIREDVCDRLAERWDIDSSDVMVRVQSGEVILDGTVERGEHRRLIEQIAETVSGVSDVLNQIRLRRQAEAQPAAAQPQAPEVGRRPNVNPPH